eukprot:1888190-Pyramimonas_sp.AAC.1
MAQDLRDLQGVPALGAVSSGMRSTRYAFFHRIWKCPAVQDVREDTVDRKTLDSIDSFVDHKHLHIA